MKALAYTAAHALSQFSIVETERPQPTIKDHDILVRVKAISVNPVDYKIRQNRSAAENGAVILGWDASGVVEALGPQVKGFKIGDEVYYAGDLTRDGSNAELQAVDSRIVALKPKSLSHTQAAAIPLTGITAYEALISQTTTKYSDNSKVLIIGGAGGVGSIGIQLLKALTPVKIYATASRAETAAWCKELGAHGTLDHSKDLKEEMKASGIDGFDFIFSTNATESYLSIMPDLLKPFGHLALIDDPKVLDIRPFKTKSITISWEFMFTKSMFQYDQEAQGKLLGHVASLIDTKEIKTTLQTELQGLTSENLKKAHTLLESGKSVGKIVITL